MTTQHQLVGRLSGVTVWRQIADTLATEIRDRTYVSSGRLPGEAADLDGAGHGVDPGRGGSGRADESGGQAGGAGMLLLRE